MNQLARNGERNVTKEPLHEYLIRTTNVGLAARTLNEVLDGIEVTLQRERVALAIWNKLIPTMAALSVEVHDARPVNVHDLNAMLLSNGLDALPLPGQAIEHTSKKVEVGEKKLEGGYTPDASE